MSLSAAHESKAVRRSCEACRGRKARFRYQGAVRADGDHTLCFACYRAERERRRARLLAEVDRPAPLRSPFNPPPRLSQSEVEHRRRMLEHLRTQAHGRWGRRET